MFPFSFVLIARNEEKTLPRLIKSILTKAGGGTISSDYLSISYSTATPATTWYAGTHSTDGGNNSGWAFTAPVSLNGSFFAFF